QEIVSSLDSSGGCLLGCSVGCSLGCLLGCLLGWKMGCSRGWKMGCSSGCSVDYLSGYPTGELHVSSMLYYERTFGALDIPHGTTHNSSIMLPSAFCFAR